MRSMGNGRAGDADAWASRERADANRARQFMPFAALRGYEGLVEERERVGEARRDLTPERAEELARSVAELRRGEAVRATYYDEAREAYASTEGTLGQVDTIFGMLYVAGRSIRFRDLTAVERLG